MLVMGGEQFGLFICAGMAIHYIHDVIIIIHGGCFVNGEMFLTLLLVYIVGNGVLGFRTLINASKKMVSPLITH